jgi:Domain of unknown function (DUF5666)
MDDQTITTTVVEPDRRATFARIGLVGAVGAALIAVGILATGASLNPSGTLAAGTTGSTTPTLDLAMPGGPGDMHGGPGGMRGFGGVTITAISGSNVSLATVDGWTRTITVDSGTTYQANGVTAALSDLKVGDEIAFRQTREADGSFTIDSITVIPPHAGGTVSATTSSSITVTQRDGTSATIKVTSATTYDVSGNSSAALGDITSGMVVMASGTRNADGSLTATAVRAFAPGAMPGRNGFDHDHDGPNGIGPNGIGPNGLGPDATSAPASSSTGTTG